MAEFRWMAVLLALALAIGCRRDTPAKEAATDAPADAGVADVVPPRAPESKPQRPAESAAAEPAKSIDSAALDRGAHAYQQGMCAKCHGPAGSGTRKAPNLTDARWDHCDGSVDGILAVLRSGVPRDKLKDKSRRPMNPVTNLVPDEQQLRDLAAYVHSLSRAGAKSSGS